jgi:hypothetical protein
MTKDQRAPSATTFRAERLPMLYKAMGIDDNPYLCFGLKEQLEEMSANIWSEPRISGSHKELRKFVAALRKLQKLWRQLAPMHRSIAEAGFLRNCPHADRNAFTMVVADSDPPYLFDDLSPMLENLVRDIDVLIDNTGDYRKRLMTKHVIERFLDIMNDLGVVPSKKLPRSRMFLALFDVLGLEPRDRVTDVTVRNAERRRKHKRQTSV